MSSVFCETSSQDHLKFKPSSSFNFEDIIKKSLPDGSIILKNQQRNAKKSNCVDNMLVVAKFAAQPLLAVGMLNTANNCYINASLQVLLRMPLFGATITRLEHNHCEMPFCMINFLKMVLKKLSRGERVPISMLLENIRAINKDFRRGQQEDAHEMILSTLEYIRSDLRCGRRANPPAEVAWVFQTIERTLFTKFRQSIRCAACANISVTTTSDAFVVVGCGESLEMALKAHFATEVLEGECAYHCDQCRAKVRATKRLAIDRPGEYFAVQLSRFHYDGYKNSSYVPFPETINLTDFTENPNGPANTYTLYAAIIHEGDSTRSGHYLSIVKVNNKYKIFNDLDVDDTSWREVKHTRPYIIIYAKVHRPVVCTSGLLKRKLAAAHSDQPLAKKTFNSLEPLQTTGRSNGEVQKRVGSHVVWHRPVVARKAQVIMSQHSPQEIQNITSKEDPFRVQKQLMAKNKWDGVPRNGFHRAGTYPSKSQEFLKAANNQRKTGYYLAKSLDVTNRPEGYSRKPSSPYPCKSYVPGHRSDNYQRKSYEALNQNDSYPRKSYESLNRSAYQRKSDCVRRCDNYQAKFVSVRPLQKENHHNGYQIPYKATNGYNDAQYIACGKNGYSNGHQNSYHNYHHNYNHNHYNYNHNAGLNKGSKSVLGNNGFHNGYKNVFNSSKESHLNGKHFYKAYQRKHQ